MTYQNFNKENEQNITFNIIEKYTRKLKTRCNVGDIAKAFIAKAWHEAIGALNDCCYLICRKILDVFCL